jgi:ABC-2 type transport system ATP-binding protein
VGLLGPNGAGKSTMLKALLGFIVPERGRMRVLGLDVAAAPLDIRARVGYMPEHDCLPSLVSAAEFLTHMAEASGLPPSMARTRAADTLRHAGLFEERYRAIGGYSTGMKQRVKLCQALVHDPAFVFLDEPTAGLDPVTTAAMDDLMVRARQELGATSVVVTHDLRSAFAVADRIAFLHQGRIRRVGPAAEIRETTDPLVREFFEGRPAGGAA